MTLKEKITKIIEKFKLKEKTWTHKGAPSNLHFFFVVGEMPLKPLKNYYGDSYSITLFDIADGYVNWWWNDEDMHRLRKSFIKKVNENPKFLDIFLKEYGKKGTKLHKISEKIIKTDLAKLSYKQLFNLYRHWYGAYIDFYSIAVTFQDAFSMHAQLFLEPHFRRIIKEKNLDFTDTYLTLINPITESFTIKEYRDRLSLVANLKSKNFIKMLNQHVEKWHWISNNYETCEYLDEKYFKKEISKLRNINVKKELKRLDEDNLFLRKKKETLIKKLNLLPESHNLIRIAEMFGYMQDDRKRYVMAATYYQDLFMREFGKRLKLPRSDMEYTFIHELKDMDKKQTAKSVFKERRKCVLVIQTLKGYFIYTGEMAKGIRDLLFKKEIVQQNEITGQIASKGLATGPVKIIRKTNDINKVRRGDVLVASMTKPETVPAMRKAGAIITDEGGITCHAAIVSRELGIPCIIGTRIATKVLKDGDFVEVDANNGVVKIIKK